MLVEVSKNNFITFEHVVHFYKHGDFITFVFADKHAIAGEFKINKMSDFLQFLTKTKKANPTAIITLDLIDDENNKNDV